MNKHFQTEHSIRKIRTEEFATNVQFWTAQEWTNRTPNATNMLIPHFLLLSWSEKSFTEITEYVSFSLKCSRSELQYKIE